MTFHPKLFYRHLEEVSNRDACDLILCGALVGWRLGDFEDSLAQDIELDYMVKGTRAPRIIVPPPQEKMHAIKAAFPCGVLEVVHGRLSRGNVRLHPKARVFTQPHGAPWTSHTINRQMRKAADACKDSEIARWKRYGDAVYKGLSFHALRHTARTIMAELEIPLHVVDCVVGHGSRKQQLMSHHYPAVPDQVLAEATRRTVDAFEAEYATAGKKASTG